MQNPLEIIFTPEIFTVQRAGGVSRYFVELARGLQTTGQYPHIIAGLHINHYLRKTSYVTGWYTRLGEGRSVPWRRRFNLALCRYILARKRRAITHLTYYTDIAYLHRSPLVVTVYDMIHELLGERFQKLRSDERSVKYKREACERADQIIAISEATKSDLVRLYKIDPATVTVVSLSNTLHIGEEPTPINSIDSVQSGDKPYLLYVGNRSNYKNFRALLEAFGRSKSLQQHFRLVCFGGGKFSDEERARINALRVEKFVEFQYGNDQALACCYRNAAAFVYPSLYEGFGLPLLEAMGQGCPVISSHAGSLPEVAGDAAVYFDPQETDSIQSMLEKTMEDSTRLSALRAAGLQRVKLFSWERCTRETLEVYRRLSG